MNADEREKWEVDLVNYGSRLHAVAAILDRVEQLERELAIARNARHCGKIVASGTGRRCLGCGDVWHSTLPHEKDDIHA